VAILERIHTAIADLATARRQVQLATDQRWPRRTRGLTTTRKAFRLPPDRPLTE